MPNPTERLLNSLAETIRSTQEGFLAYIDELVENGELEKALDECQTRLGRLESLKNIITTTSLSATMMGSRNGANIISGVTGGVMSFWNTNSVNTITYLNQAATYASTMLLAANAVISVMTLYAYSKSSRQTDPNYEALLHQLAVTAATAGTVVIDNILKILIAPVYGDIDQKFLAVEKLLNAKEKYPEFNDIEKENKTIIKGILEKGNKELESLLRDPISWQMIINPAVVSSGITYDYASISNHILENMNKKLIDPLTRIVITEKLIPHKTINILLRNLKDNPDIRQAPALRDAETNVVFKSPYIDLQTGFTVEGDGKNLDKDRYKPDKLVLNIIESLGLDKKSSNKLRT